MKEGSVYEAAFSLDASLDDSTFLLEWFSLILAWWLIFFTDVVTSVALLSFELLESLVLNIVMYTGLSLPVNPELLVYAIFGCAGASLLAARAFTTATLSVGEFQWEYKETVAGMSLIPTCYRQGKTEELDISRDGDKIILITGLAKAEVGRRNVGALSNEELNWVVDSVQAYQRQITAI